MSNETMEITIYGRKHVFKKLGEHLWIHHDVEFEHTLLVLRFINGLADIMQIESGKSGRIINLDDVSEVLNENNFTEDLKL
jgi:hypothetical protein